MADLKGLKRICMSCGARFYDLNKKPIICPSCSTEFTGEIKVKARRGRLSDVAEAEEEIEDVVPEVVEAETEEVEADEETVSLEEIEEDDADEDEIPLDDDLAIDDDLDDVEDDDIEEDIAEDEEK